jgi:hypothetical protein
MGALFIDTGQATVASHIGRQDGCEPSLYPLGDQGDLPLNYWDYTTALSQRVDLLGGFNDVGDAPHALCERPGSL